MSVLTGITIGNFDGVHLGHAALVQACRQEVGFSGKVMVLSFDPHPSTLLRPESVPGRLSGFDQRTQWLKAIGASEVAVLQPTPEFLAQSPEDFLTSLVGRFAPSVIVAGQDFRFGRGRAGSISMLRDLEARHGYRTVVVDPIEAVLRDQSMVRVSSSMIRWLIGHGRVGDARLLLGRPYQIEAAVVQGQQRGREIGAPTVNLEHLDRMLPADGIYAGVAGRPDGSLYPAAISVGTKPTFGRYPRVCEAHLIGYDGPLNDYGWTVRVDFHEWLRDQLQYPHVDELIEQIDRDIRRVTQIVGRLMPTQHNSTPTQGHKPEIARAV